MDDSAKEKLFDSLMTTETQKILKTISELLEAPVLLTDTDNNYIFHYPKKLLNDPFWDDTVINGKMSLSWFNELDKYNMLSSYDDTGIVYRDFGFMKDAPRIFVNLQDKNRHYGHLTVMRADRSKEFRDMVFLARQTLLLHRKVECAGKDPVVDRTDFFFRYLLENRISTEDELLQWQNDMNLKLHPEYMVAVIHMRTPETAKRVYGYLFLDRSTILSCMEKDQIILLLSGRWTHKEKREFILQSISKLDYYVVGYSETFTDLFEVSRYKEEAVTAARYGQKHAQKSYDYRECILERILDDLQNCGHPRDLVHPALRRLQTYDRINNTSLTETLKSYLTHQKDTKATIEELAIHRNSLPKRLERISEIGRIDLDNHETVILLNLSFHMLDHSVNFAQ